MVSNVNSIITSGDLGGGLIPTEYATSPFAKKLMMLDDTPPGQVPTNTKPSVRPGERLNSLAIPIANNGIIVYCIAAPIKISKGR